VAIDDALRQLVREEIRSALGDLLPAPTEPVPLALTLGQAAERTGLSERTLRRAIADGRLRALRSGRSVRVPLDALRAFVEGAA
jgi:excisionase family DNA binding protein